MRFHSSISFSSCQQNLIKTFQIKSMIALITKSRSILMLHKITKNKKCAPKLIFFNEFFFLERFGYFLTLKIDFENQNLAFFDIATTRLFGT